MTVRTKITFTIIGTLLVGMFLGVAGTRIAFEIIGPPPPGNFDPDKMPDRLTNALTRALDPTDEQRDTVRAILAKHAGIATARIQAHMEEQRELMDSLKADLSRVVTPEQITSLERRLQFMQRMFDGPRAGRGQGRRQGGPPPPRGDDFPDEAPPGERPPGEELSGDSGL